MKFVYVEIFFMMVKNLKMSPLYYREKDCKSFLF